MLDFVKSLLKSLQERSVLLVAIFILSITAISLAYYFGGAVFASTFILPFIVLFLGVSKDIWSSDSGQTVIAKLSILAIIVLVFGASISPLFTDVLLEPLYEVIPILKGKIPAIPISYPVVIIGLIAILLINYLMRDGSAMNKHSTPLEKEFPERDYKEKLKAFCRILKDDLDRIEREGNWSAELFVPLEAEVEIRQATKISKRKKDLLSALKKEKKAKTFLVVGQPGAGKSVALRKLCRDLLQEVDKTGKVPVYVNLKEWSSASWSEESPLSQDKFHEFVLKSLKNQGDRFTADFLKVYFDRMVENGRIFFIFDSFDEIPALLEDEDDSRILNEISKIVHKYLNGAHDSRGIVATRPYKRPTNQLLADATIQILPLTEERVAEAMKKYPSVKENSINKLLTTRREMLPIAKNPFYCALIVNYLQDNKDSLPENRSDLFQSYIEKRLEDCSQKIEEKGLSKTDVKQVCQEIVALMFDSETFGFEIPISELQEHIYSYDDEDLKKIIDVLVYSKIGRHSNSEKTLFTFSHKRFAEYFAVLSRLGNENEELLKDIHNDGKWRDVMVLLAELEDENKSYAIALYSWNKLAEAHNEIAKTGKTFSYRTIHGLRFLRDTYLSRRFIINRLQNNLEKYISQQLTAADTILEKKIALECVGLLDEESINLIILEALRQNNDWLSETALKSCFYLNRIDPRLQKSLLVYLDSFPIFQFLVKYKNLLFPLTLTNLFDVPKRFLYVKLIDNLIILVLYACHAFYNPFTAIIYVFVLLLKLENPMKKTESFSVAEVFFLRGRVALIPLLANGFTVFINWILYPLNYEIQRWSIPSWLLLFSILVFIPWYQLYYYLIKYKDIEEIIFKVIRLSRKEIITLDINGTERQAYILELNEKIATSETILTTTKPLFYLCIFVFMLSVFMIVISLLPESLRIYAYGIGVSIVSIPYLASIWEYVHLLKDYKINKKFLKTNEFSRSKISDHFFKLKTESGRLNFVNQLGSRGNAPSGEWIDKLPNINNDKASIRLAQLEESWRNLDR